MHNVFVSTNAFPTGHLKRILEACLAVGISGIELSSNISSAEDVLPELEKYNNTDRLSFLVHNYFPAPRDPFVLNLASNDEHILKSSREHCMRAVALCERLGVPFYSLHAGFCFHAGPEDLGKRQKDLPLIEREEAEEIFTESLTVLCDYAGRLGVDILVENNVLAPFNLIDSQNKLFLGVLSHDLLRMLDVVGDGRLRLLLDVGHLKVSARSLGVDPVRQIQELAPFVRAVHLSDNDGERDSNEKLTRQSWFWPALVKYMDRPTAYILEVYNLSPEEIMSQLELIGEQITEG